MALATYPAVSSPVKSVQRGSAAGAGTVTITAVDTAKSFVNVFGTTSSGSVAAAGAIGATTLTVTAHNSRQPAGNQYYSSPQPQGVNNAGNAPNTGGSNNRNHFHIPARTDNIAAANFVGGANNLVAAVIQGYLSGSTSLVVSGACRWEVVEFN